MGIQIWIFYAFIVLLAFLPFFRIDLYLKDRKYKNFLYLNITLVIWTAIIGIRLVAVEAFVIYYLSLFIFPLVILSVVLLFLSVNKFLGKTVNKTFKTILFSLVIIDFVLSMTNNYHSLFVVLPYNSSITLNTFIQAPLNIGFMMHSIISYGIILYVFTLLIGSVKNFV